MSLMFSILVGLLLLSPVLWAVLLASAWTHRHTPVGRAFLPLTICCTAWSLCAALSALSPTPELAALFESKLMRLPQALTTPAALHLIFVSTGWGDRLSRGHYAVLIGAVMIAPVLAFVQPEWFLYGAEYHQLGPLLFAEQVQRGPWFYVNIVVHYGALLVGLARTIGYAFTAPPLYQRQAMIITLGMLLPALGNMVWMAASGGSHAPDLTVVGLTFSGIAFEYGLFRLQLFDLGPIARDAIVQNMGDATIALDRQGRVVDFNPAALKLLPHSAEPMGRMLSQTLPEWQDVFEWDDVEPGEVTLRRGGGERVYQVDTSPIMQGVHEMGRLVVLRDITERKSVEVAREGRITELEAFAHTVAHDLKSPLAAIGMAIELLKANADEADSKTLARSERSVRKMSALIDDLLLLAMVKQLAAVPADRLDMARILEQCLQHLRLGPNDVVALPVDWLPAVGYAPWVEAIWTNYLTNAMKYGGSPACIEVGSAPTEAAFTRFYVRDHGRGIAPDKVDMLFLAGNSLPRAGHGLGLSIVRRIADRLGGEVGLDETPGGGCTFWFNLPNGTRADWAEEGEDLGSG